ncbi:hypothetical protein U1Q18_005423 [Sarracenia purpurea var. burkii]
MWLGFGCCLCLPCVLFLVLSAWSCFVCWPWVFPCTSVPLRWLSRCGCAVSLWDLVLSWLCLKVAGSSVLLLVIPLLHLEGGLFYAHLVLSDSYAYPLAAAGFVSFAFVGL